MHRPKDNLWDELPREDRGFVQVGPSRIFIGVFWALVMEVGMAAIAWLAYVLWRVL